MSRLASVVDLLDLVLDGDRRSSISSPSSGSASPRSDGDPAVALGLDRVDLGGLLGVEVGDLGLDLVLELGRSASRSSSLT